MLKAEHISHSQGPPTVPARLVIFWAHNPERSDRLLKKTFMHYKIDAEISSAAAGNVDDCSLAEWRFKVSHFKPLVAGAASAGPSPQTEAQSPDKITFIYALKIAPYNSDVALTDSNLNKVVNKTFDRIADLLLNYDLKEIIFVNETNVFFSGYSIDMLPEIKDRFASKIKLCENPVLKQKLSIVDLSNIAALAVNEAHCNSLRTAQQIPLIMGFQEGAGGKTAEDLAPPFKTLFSLARCVDNGAMQSLNRLSMALIQDKTLFHSDKFTENGTSFSLMVQKMIRASTPKTVSSPAGSSSLPSSSAASPRPATARSLTGTPKLPPRSASLSSVSESNFLSEPFWQWPGERNSSPSSQSLNSVCLSSSPVDPCGGFDVISSPFANGSHPLPLAPRWQNVSLSDFEPESAHLALGNPNLLTSQSAPGSFKGRSASASSIMYTLPAFGSSSVVSPVIMSRDIVSAIPSLTPSREVLLSNGSSAFFRVRRPTPILMPSSSSMPPSPIVEPQTPVQAQKSNSCPTSIERKPVQKKYSSEEGTNEHVSPIGRGVITRGVSVGEGELLFDPLVSFFPQRQLTTEPTNLTAAPSLI